MHSSGLRSRKLEIVDPELPHIWETYGVGVKMEPGCQGELKARTWAVAEEHIVSQRYVSVLPDCMGRRTWALELISVTAIRFAKYTTDHQRASVDFLVLLLFPEKEKATRLVAYEETWISLAEYSSR